MSSFAPQKHVLSRSERRLFAVILQQMAIALIPPHVEQVVGHGVFHAAGGFVRVRAVGEAAAIDEGADVAEEAGDFSGDYVPKLKLTDARRIDHVAALRQAKQ